MAAADRDLQQIVDDLGRRTSRSVAIDDRQHRLLAHSRHYGEVDEARLASVLTRVASDSTIRHVRAQGVERAEAAVRVPAAPDFLPRVCVPILHRGLRLGLLWLIDADETMSDAEVALATVAAEEAGTSIYRRSLLRHRERGRERELARDLLGDDPAGRDRAASALVEENVLVPGPVVVLVVGGLDLADQSTRVALDGALIETGRRLPTRHALHLVRDDHGLLVVGEHGGLAGADAQARLGARLRDDVTAAALPTAVVGVGAPRPALDGARSSYDEALLAARVARLVPSVGDVARWDDLGVYGTLVQLPAPLLTAEGLDPGFRRLLAADGDGALVTTLEVYLDLACSSQRTAEALQLHRTSVYYRLTRIAELSGLDLEVGADRLALHLAVKTARLAGVVT